MKIIRIGINETQLELSDAELVELAHLIELGIEHLEEYNDLRFLKEHDKHYYKDTAELMRLLANYEN